MTTACSSHYKQSIALRFTKAVNTYDQYNHLQMAALDFLEPRLSSESLCSLNDMSRWLDVGCGTGESVGLLQSTKVDSSVVAIDLSHAMAARTQVKTGAEVLVADAEQLPFANGAFNGVFSSLAIQWCQSKARLFQEFLRVLQPNRMFLASTLLEGSMPELRDTWRLVDGRLHHNLYEHEDQLRELLKQAGFSNVTVERIPFTLYFDDVKSLLDSVRKVGASTLTDEQQQPLTRSLWHAFEEHYQALRQPEGLPLTYQIGIIQAVK